MPRRKPAGWPKLMSSKRLAGGVAAYYWEAPTWAKKAGCTVQAQALGTDYGTGKQRCDAVLNPQYDAWRTGGASLEPTAARGTFDWMALALASKHKLKDGRFFGSLSLASITPGAADRLHAKLKEKPGGGTRARTALASIQYCRRAWNVARRDKPDLVPHANSFTQMDISYTAERTRPVSYVELMKFVAGADNAGEPSIGTAAMIAFFWLQRQVDILSRLAWSQYRPRTVLASFTIRLGDRRTDFGGAARAFRERGGAGKRLLLIGSHD